VCTLLEKNLSTSIRFKQVILKGFLRLNLQPVQLIWQNNPPAFTTIIIMHCNMYHKRPLDAQNAQPIPMPERGRSKRPKAGSWPPQGTGIA
jgi:hypothetical protein